MRTILFLAFFSIPGILSAQGEKAPTTFEVAGKTFAVPAGWESEKPSSAMRKAQLKAGDAEVVVFFFGKGGGGGVDANVKRWMAQFKPEGGAGAGETATEEITGGKVTTVTTTGTFMKGPPFGEKQPMAGYALRGAILEFDGGPLFIKMTGPKKAVADAAEAFDKLVRSAFAK